MHKKDSPGHWCCGTFLSRTEVLHNPPLSILRHAGYKKNESFPARDESQCEIFRAPLAVFHFYTNARLCFGDFSFVSIFSQWGEVRAIALVVAGNMLVRFAYAWWTVLWSKPSPCHFPSLWLHLAHFTPKRRHSGVETLECLHCYRATVCAGFQLTKYFLKKYAYLLSCLRIRSTLLSCSHSQSEACRWII